jgi:hypothetical protein
LPSDAALGIRTRLFLVSTAAAVFSSAEAIKLTELRNTAVLITIVESSLPFFI